jgi:hypothetical protein
MLIVYERIRKAGRTVLSNFGLSVIASVLFGGFLAAWFIYIWIQLRA